MNIWEHNDLSNIQVEDFEDSKIYWMDDFYKYPDLVYEEITREDPPLWKYGEDWNTEGSQNNIRFIDARWNGEEKEGLDVPYRSLSKIFNQSSSDEGFLVTNHTRFFTDEQSLEFNNYKDNFWWPHTDSGYNAIVYLNKSEDGSEYGTNLYKVKNEKFLPPEGTPEHANPWHSKDNWDLIAAFKSKYNRLVAFNGFIYYHGMSVDSDKWFHETRVNQVMFFNDENFDE